MSIVEERDCTDRCKSKQHGETICAALTKRTVSDDDLCAYLNSLCSRCESVKDDFGRTALHIATSCGRMDVVKWLLHVRLANINSKDDESGYTSLHRSIFYGKIDIAAYLIEQGASTTAVDLDGLTGLELAMKDGKTTPFLHKIDKSQVYVWGSNTNYVFGPRHARSVPELLDSFHKENPQVYIKQVCLEKFHCVLVTNDGQVYACGHGYGGRLGLSTKETYMAPKLIDFTPRLKTDSDPVRCSRASISIDHSVFLSTSGHVWTCGLNTHYVLGIKPPPTQVLKPYQLKYLHTQIRGIGTGRYHTVAWGSENIFTWGLNGGQLGHNKIDGQYIVTPKMVSCLFKPKAVAVSDFATAVLSTHGNVYIYHDFQMIKIGAKHLSLTTISVSGGRLNNKLDNIISEEITELRVIGLNTFGNLYIWQESTPIFLRCIFSTSRSLNIFQVTLNLNEILFVTQDGEAFHGTIKHAKKKNISGNKNISQPPQNQLIKVIKVPNVYRALSFNSDYDGKNFAVLQVTPSALLELPEVSQSIMTEDMLKLLYSRENESLQNVTFKICDRLFYAHQYIIAAGSTTLYKMIKTNHKCIIEFSNANPDDFEKIILYLYSLKYTSSHIDKLLKNANIFENKDELIDETISERKIKDSGNFPKMDNGLKSPARFSYTAFPELHDVVLRSKDEKLIAVHGCILIARSEYFSNCFSMRWNENSVTEQEIPMPFPYNTLLPLIEYLYTDELPSLSNADLDQICNVLIAADHMCIFRLKEICERTLCTCVTLKNVGQVLTFASNYLAEKLKQYCMKFISLNLAAVLETRTLEHLDDQLLLKLRYFYCSYNPIMLYRIITTYSTAPSDETVIEAARLYPIVLQATGDGSKPKSPPKSQKRRTRQRKSSSSETKQLDVEDSSPSETRFQTNLVGDVPSRIKAIVSAHDTMFNSGIAPTTYTKLIKSEEFPTLTNHSNIPKQHKSEKHVDKLEIKQKITKVSQKERKRLSSLAESSISESPVSESPKNPWKLVPEINGLDKTVPVKSIIVEEKRQKENFVKMKFKHLVHIQIEDKAIEDLYKFYNAGNVFDEIITIRRVQMGAIATPQWSHTNKKN